MINQKLTNGHYNFCFRIQNRTQNVTKTNVQHKVHPTYYGNVSSCTQTTTKFRSKPSSESLTKREKILHLCFIIIIIIIIRLMYFNGNV